MAVCSLTHLSIVKEYARRMEFVEIINKDLTCGMHACQSWANRSGFGDERTVREVSGLSSGGIFSYTGCGLAYWRRDTRKHAQR
jgi:hypothetical protein